MNGLQKVHTCLRKKICLNLKQYCIFVPRLAQVVSTLLKPVHVTKHTTDSRKLLQKKSTLERTWGLCRGWGGRDSEDRWHGRNSHGFRNRLTWLWKGFICFCVLGERRRLTSRGARATSLETQSAAVRGMGWLAGGGTGALSWMRGASWSDESNVCHSTSWAEEIYEEGLTSGTYQRTGLFHSFFKMNMN